MNSVCGGIAKYDDEYVPCKNPATKYRKLNFTQWIAEIELCESHAELWDMPSEPPTIVRYIPRGTAQ